MKAADHKRKLPKHGFQHWHQPQFRDLRRGRHNLPLRHLVHGVDVINALAAVLIALMHGVDAQVSGQALRLRLAPLADRNRRGPRRLVAGVALPIGRRVAEPVELRHRDPRQPLVGRLAIFAVLALQNPLGRRPAQVPVRLVHIGQQVHIGGRVARGELGALIRHRLHPARLADTPRSAASPAPGLVPSSARHTAAPVPCPAGPGWRTGAAPASAPPSRTLPRAAARQTAPVAARQKRPDLLQARGFRIVHADDQSPASRSSPFRLILYENPMPVSGSSCMRQEQYRMSGRIQIGTPPLARAYVGRPCSIGAKEDGPVEFKIFGLD